MATFVFSIDGHQMTVIESDGNSLYLCLFLLVKFSKTGVDTEATAVDQFPIGSSQRCKLLLLIIIISRFLLILLDSVIVNADQDISNFWIRADIMDMWNPAPINLNGTANNNSVCRD